MKIGLAPTALTALLLAGCGGGDAAAPTRAPVQAGQAAAVPAGPVQVAPEIAAFYAERGHRPLWVSGGKMRPEAFRLAGILEGARDHGLDPERYGAAELGRALAATRSGDRRALARAELLLSRGFTDFVADLRVPARDAMVHVDEGLAPEQTSGRALLEGAAAAPALGTYLSDATRMNPLYESLRRGFAQWRAAGGTPSESEAALIGANLERARAIPSHAGRYVIVDTASARLWMIEGNRVEGPMRVIVGKRAMQTPAMAGLLRYAMLNPYWNLPPDLARDRARRVLREGTGWLGRERLELLSDWGDSARILAPSQVDWAAVAAGRRTLRMRQLPGGANVMGAVKFMMPNELGIYLHDFPDKSLFGRADRRLSSGCVRLEDAPRLGRWLFGGGAPRPSGPAPEQRVDLPEPVPVYIIHLTVLPDPRAGLSFRTDGYGRDRQLIAAAADSRRAGSQPRGSRGS